MSVLRSAASRGRLAPAAVAGLIGLLSLCGLVLPHVAGAAVTRQAAGADGPAAGISFLHVAPPSGPIGRPSVTAYVQVFDRGDPPVGRTAIAGLPASAFSATEDGRPVTLSVRQAAADEPLALIVVADTSIGRGWLPAGPKYSDPLLYLRDASTRVLRDLPPSGRYALYTMAEGAEGTPPLGDRAAAESAAQQLRAAPNARLLERMEQAVDALKAAPDGWRRIIVVLSDGNSAFGRSYELVQGAAAQAHVAVFATGTIDPNNPFRFLDRMAQETGGNAWLFDKADLQPQASSPVLLDLLADQIVRAIKSAYRVEYSSAAAAGPQHELIASVKIPTAELKSSGVSYTLPAGPAVAPLLLLLLGVPVLVLAAGGAYYYWRLRAERTDYYLVGHGPSASHVSELYLFTAWRPLGRGGRGYQLKPEDPHFAGISKTHAFVRVNNLRRVKLDGGQVQQVGTVEVRAGRPGTGVGLNTAYVYNEVSGVRQIGERPFQMQKGDLLILQSGVPGASALPGLPAGVYLRLGVVDGTVVEHGTGGDSGQTVVESVTTNGQTVVEQARPVVSVGPRVRAGGIGPSQGSPAGAPGNGEGTHIGEPAGGVPPSPERAPSPGRIP